MDKIKIFNVILNVVIVVAVIGSILYANSAAKKIAVLETKVDNVDTTLFVLNQKIDTSTMNMVDMWYSNLPKETMTKFGEWEIANNEFISCKKTFKNLLLSRNYYDNNATYSRAVIYQFNKGDLVYERDGEVHCSLYPIEDMNPPKIDCKQICETEDAKEE